MFAPHQYQLLDFGEGRKLERFGPWVLDRPSPAAEDFAKSLSNSAWRQSTTGRYERFDNQRGRWYFTGAAPERWTVEHGQTHFELKASDVGHLGIFPEQAENWDWIAEQATRAGEPLKVLNLFAYTGGSTLAAAAAGAQVTHVDAAQNVVAWARRNAELSSLAAAPVRWIAEDATKFVRREIKRGNRYDAVILDPPSYGHGPAGEVWKIETDLEPLVALCAELTHGRPRFMLLTCHSPGFGPQQLARVWQAALGATARGRSTASELTLTDSAGRALPCGASARWESLE